MAYFDFGPWHDFLNELRSTEDQLGRPSTVWYRGVSDERHELKPSLLRRSNGLEKEKELYNRYRLLANVVLREHRSDWQYLFDMQHYRLPTRLLDWTEVLGIAVFFALTGSDNQDAAVYVLDPLGLNARSSKNEIPAVDEDKSFDYKTIYWEHKPMPPVAPIAVEVSAQNNRILAQRGKFTIHGIDTRPIEEQFPSSVKKVVLRGRTKDGAREFLRISGITEFSVFPDIVGLVPFLESIVGIK